ncbi:hypothetical protein L3X38_022363 [Prunus dulcis]|uniref:Uncharacterized protein n=1 Tax=Prunus dulcis TaxID=3755 RepID=A0AAD4VVS7_PRUDU|nr:hypothetical protein L3X38_022363 [Prunus dulcis]
MVWQRNKIFYMSFALADWIVAWLTYLRGPFHPFGILAFLDFFDTCSSSSCEEFNSPSSHAINFVKNRFSCLTVIFEFNWCNNS